MALRKKKESTAPKAGVNDYAVLVRPLVTEKSSMISALESKQGGRTVFRVPLAATKSEIKLAVERIYSVEVHSVNTCAYLGKMKRTATGSGRKNSFKKAYVTLKKGHTINVVEGL
jgi:large subunit ribosomal protein L23